MNTKSVDASHRLPLSTASELRNSIPLIQGRVGGDEPVAHSRNINQLAFRLVLIAENEVLNEELLRAINEVENALGGEVVTAPILFKDQRNKIDNQIKAGERPSDIDLMYIFEYTRRIRALALENGVAVPEYKGTIRGRL